MRLCSSSRSYLHSWLIQGVAFVAFGAVTPSSLLDVLHVLLPDSRAGEGDQSDRSSKSHLSYVTPMSRDTKRWVTGPAVPGGADVAGSTDSGLRVRALERALLFFLDFFPCRFWLARLPFSDVGLACGVMGEGLVRSDLALSASSPLSEAAVAGRCLALSSFSLSSAA